LPVHPSQIASAQQFHLQTPRVELKERQEKVWLQWEVAVGRLNEISWSHPLDLSSHLLLIAE